MPNSNCEVNCYYGNLRTRFIWPYDSGMMENNARLLFYFINNKISYRQIILKFFYYYYISSYGDLSLDFCKQFCDLFCGCMTLKLLQLLEFFSTITEISLKWCFKYEEKDKMKFVLIFWKKFCFFYFIWASPCFLLWTAMGRSGAPGARVIFVCFSNFLYPKINVLTTAYKTKMEI